LQYNWYWIVFIVHCFLLEYCQLIGVLLDYP
jgi:hypothetical protein